MVVSEERQQAVSAGGHVRSRIQSLPRERMIDERIDVISGCAYKSADKKRVNAFSVIYLEINTPGCTALVSMCVATDLDKEGAHERFRALRETTHPSPCHAHA